MCLCFHVTASFCGLGAGAVEFIISHAEVTIAFAEEKKMPEVQVKILFI